ncbi:MAG: MFS transporter [Propionibacterium sp.]|nr:MFS transporter [Propionibacterium sp.]
MFAVALNLRPALTSVGPVLPRLGADLALNEGMQGLLGAIPVCRAAGTGRVLHAAAH